MKNVVRGLAAASLLLVFAACSGERTERGESATLGAQPSPSEAAGNPASTTASPNEPAVTAPAPAPDPAPEVARDADPNSLYGGVYNVAQAERGNRIQQVECGACHTPGEWEQGRVLGAFTGRSVQDLIDHIRSMMPLDAPGRLSYQEYTDIVAYMLQLNRVPTGEAEMPADETRLRQIRVEYRP